MGSIRGKLLLYPWALAVLLLSSCLPKHQILENPSAGSVRGPVVSRQPTGASQSGLEYIARYQKIAIEEMQRHKIPASIKLAQAILESGHGNSRLAREANNHFGIKCASDWRGPRIFHDDDEKNDCFRSYATPEESFRDHSLFLLRRRYEKLFTLDPRDYRGWAYGLKDAGYATNPRYAELLIDIIERYELYQFDAAGAPLQAGVPPQPAAQSKARTSAETGGRNQTSVQSQTVSTSSRASGNPGTMRIHEVMPGETATAIALKYGLSLQQLMLLNGLKNSELHPGQLLLVSQ